MALVGAIDSAMLSSGFDVYDQAGRVVLVLQGWTATDWANAAAVARLETPPSDETKRIVYRLFLQRAKAKPVAMVMQ